MSLRKDWVGKREGHHLALLFTFAETAGTLHRGRSVTRFMEEASGSTSEYMQFWGRGGRGSVYSRSVGFIVDCQLRVTRGNSHHKQCRGGG